MEVHMGKKLALAATSGLAFLASACGGGSTEPEQSSFDQFEHALRTEETVSAEAAYKVVIPEEGVAGEETARYPLIIEGQLAIGACEEFGLIPVDTESADQVIGNSGNVVPYTDDSGESFIVQVALDGCTIRFIQGNDIPPPLQGPVAYPATPRG